MTTYATGLTDTIVSALVALSGGQACGYSWQGVGGTSRPPAYGRRGLRVLMDYAQQHLCPQCGASLSVCPNCSTMLPESGQCRDCGVWQNAEFAHVVSRGTNARHSDDGHGWTAGNIMLAHGGCNELQKSRGPVVRVADMARPDMVMVEWPPLRIMKANDPNRPA